MIYTNNNGKLKPVKQIDFKLEKELQHLVEENMDTLFGIKFLATEFVMTKFRFDSVAYSKENNTFIIVEYKKGQNESLVDQGYAYLNTVLDRKADLVLLFNKVMHDSKQIEDFDWSAIRVFFVSPKFTEYQRTATGYQKMPFSLFEVNQYENGNISVNEINDNKIKEDPGVLLSPKNNKTKEIHVYTEDDLIQDLADSLKETYENLKMRILELGNIKIEPKKLYIAFKCNNKNICDVEPFKKNLKVFLNLPYGKLADANQAAKDVSQTGHHGNGDYSVDINCIDDIDYLMTLIRQAYKFNN
jgi:Uncharacterized conserved protein